MKLYQTLVTIDEVLEGLKPDGCHEVTIQVGPGGGPGAVVPIQAVVGGSEIGRNARCT